MARRCGLPQNKQIEKLCPKNGQIHVCGHRSSTVSYCALPVYMDFGLAFRSFSFSLINLVWIMRNAFCCVRDREHAGSFLFCHQYAVMISILWKRDRNGKETLPTSGHKTNVEFWLGTMVWLCCSGISNSRAHSCVWQKQPCFIHMCRTVKLRPLCELYCAVCQNKSPPTKVCFPRRTCGMCHEPNPPHHKGIRCLFCSSAFICDATD